ncbi:hypothetical protein CQA62_06755 [Helicobacter cholecystus]|uniref:Uncharacterized protein n=1 Tax=Helicobacter cholecystus TaxID=45498 RepID=A0A3D8INK2_9HELI|nr:hypothetical protein CQA62_06755 [Helicobacter cholecystus]VEJ24409.1 Uncharacterised protein [Helicobacter cholecystus]
MELSALITFNNLTYPLFPCFLYFYNLIHDKTNRIKNFLIRIMLLGSATLFSYKAYENNGIGLLVLSIPLLLLMALCLIKKYPLNNRYTKHMLWIYLFLFIGIILSYAQTIHIIEKRVIGYVLLLPLILIVGLTFYSSINYLIRLKSYLNKHDGLCLFWCFNWMMIIAVDFFKPLLEMGNLMVYYISAFSNSILGIVIFLYHSFYFIRLIFFKSSTLEK